MSRLVSIFAVVVLMLAFAPLANTTDANAALLQGDDTLGEQVSVPGPDGEEIALASVESMQDPFQEYDPAYPPIHGYHYVLIEIFVEVTGPAGFQVDPSKILIRDTDGFLYGDDTIYREEGATAPDLQYLEVASGSAAAGAVGFQVLNDVIIADILLIPANGQLIKLADFGEAATPGVLDDVPWIGYEGEEIGLIVVRELIDPFEDYAPDYPPDRGSRYVMVTVTIENTGPRQIQIDPSNFLVQDSDGFLYGPQTIYQPAESEKPALEYGDLAPGDSATGSVGFVVLKGVDLARVLYQPVGDRLLTLADLTTGGPSGQTTVEPTARPGPGDAEIDCDEIEPWLTYAHTEASAVNTLVPTLLFMRVENDPDYLEIGHQIADAFILTAETLTSQPVPPSVEELNQQLADALTAYGEATEQLLTAEESGDEDAIEEAGQVVYDAEPALITAVQAVADLAETCGIEVDE